MKKRLGTLVKLDPNWTRGQWSKFIRFIRTLKGKTTLKELIKEEQDHFGEKLNPNEPKKEILLGFINIHTLPESFKGEKYLISKI